MLSLSPVNRNFHNSGVLIEQEIKTFIIITFKLETVNEIYKIKYVYVRIFYGNEKIEEVREL